VARNKERVDKLLVERGLAPTRTKAQALVMAGQVFVGEKRIEKPGDQLAIDVALALRGQERFVSRGGHKLEAALQHFAIDVAGRVALDVGASTGGFTDCLLQHGASRVYAVDVGTHQLHEKLRADPRVILREQFNARELSSDVVREPVQLIVIDVSFISLRLVLPSALAFLEPGGVLVALVKPQFEAGRAEVDRGGGVISDPVVRQAAIDGIVAFVEQPCGLRVRGTIDSPIAGPAGNVEALLVAERSTGAPAGIDPR
jgi:23S rRNA (cytidine1920-2'-O)/16S rRNA (cytidine1409-2'-O)-methyltransferase